MNNKIIKSLIYFIFSAVFISSTAFFINNNFSLRIYIDTFIYVTVNYSWFIVLFCQFIYIYRINNLGVNNLLFFNIVICILYLIITTIFCEFDYTSLGKNHINNLFIHREDFYQFNVYNYEIIRKIVSKFKIYNPEFIIFFFNPFFLLLIKSKFDNSSLFLSLFFILITLFYILFNKFFYIEFYFLLIFLFIKFRRSFENC